MQRIPALDITPAQSGEKIHVRLFSGRFQTLRRLISWPLLLAYFGLAWVNINGQQALLFSIEDRRLYFFGTQWGWHDFPVLAGVFSHRAVCGVGRGGSNLVRHCLPAKCVDLAISAHRRIHRRPGLDA